MEYLERTNYILSLIEDRELLSREDIIEMYRLDKEGVKSIFGEPDFQHGLRFAGSNYWLREHVHKIAELRGFDVKVLYV